MMDFVLIARLWSDLKMLQKNVLVTLAAGLSLTSAFLLPTPTRSVSRLQAADGSADIEGLVKSLETAQDQVFTNLQTALKIELSDYPDSLGLAVWEKKAHKGEVFGYKGNTRLVWTGRIKASSYDDKNFFTETAIWVGPLTQVPHLVMSSSVGPEGVRLHLDYVARDDLLYTTGNSHLKEYYGSDTLQALYANIEADTTVLDRPAPRGFEARTLQSPMAISLLLPATAESVDKVSAWSQAHVECWLGWMESAEEVQRMKRGQMLSRDTGVRRLWVEAAAEGYTGVLGGDKEGGKQLAIAVSGPMQQQYVGQGS